MTPCPAATAGCRLPREVSLRAIDSRRLLRHMSEEGFEPSDLGLDLLMTLI
jgi:hypothetical protein